MSWCISMTVPVTTHYITDWAISKICISQACLHNTLRELSSISSKIVNDGGHLSRSGPIMFVMFRIDLAEYLRDIILRAAANPPPLPVARWNIELHKLQYHKLISGNLDTWTIFKFLLQQQLWLPPIKMSGNKTLNYTSGCSGSTSEASH